MFCCSIVLLGNSIAELVKDPYGKDLGIEASLWEEEALFETKTSWSSAGLELTFLQITCVIVLFVTSILCAETLVTFHVV